MEILALIIAIVLLGMLASWFVSARAARQVERGIVFRFGRALPEKFASRASRSSCPSSTGSAR